MSAGIFALKATTFSTFPNQLGRPGGKCQIQPYFAIAGKCGVTRWVNIGGYELGLQSEEPHVTGESDSVVAYGGVDNIQEACDRPDLGATEHVKPQNVGGEFMAATVQGPFTNVTGLNYYPYFKSKK